MSERARKPPRLSEQGRAERESRRARLAEALRDNLKKRKAQSRGRAAAEHEPGSAGSGEGEVDGEA
jgi:hypothetical protein